jgi:hypothetical protein
MGLDQRQEGLDLLHYVCHGGSGPAGPHMLGVDHMRQGLRIARDGGDEILRLVSTSAALGEEMIGAARDTSERRVRPVGRKIRIAKGRAFSRLDIGEADAATRQGTPVDRSLMSRDVDADHVVAQRGKLDAGEDPRSGEDCAEEKSGERADPNAAHEASLVHRIKPPHLLED